MDVKGVSSRVFNRSGGERGSASSESPGSDMLQKQAQKKVRNLDLYSPRLRNERIRKQWINEDADNVGNISPLAEIPGVARDSR
jgi:hypothetical protein